MGIAGIILCIVGGVILGGAKSEQLHGWHQTTCYIRYPEGLGPAEVGNAPWDCSYYMVTSVFGEGGPACAIDAEVAAHAVGGDAPACPGAASSEWPNRTAPAAWLDEGGAEAPTPFPCLWPQTAPVPADECMTAATTPGLLSRLWRSSQDRFVYLVGHPKWGRAVVDSATADDRSFGTGLILGGVALLAAASALAALRHINGCFEAACMGCRFRAATRLREQESEFKQV